MDMERMRATVSRARLHDSRQRGMWKYRDMLPVLNPKSALSLGEGYTNLLRSESLAHILGMKKLFIKDETTNPSGSFLDRGMAVEISRARALGFGSASCAWSGNLAASLAAYCARGGMRSRVYLPGEIDLGKLYQIVAYGAEIVPSSDKEDANRRLLEAMEEHYPVTGSNPFFLEGMKTTAVEVVDQLDWTAPDWIALPVGNGVHLSMLAKGLREIEALGLIEDVHTRFLAVQIEGCSPIVDAVKGASKRERINVSSFARDISVEKPSMGEDAVEAIRATGGDAVAVSEHEMLDSVMLLARSEGIFAEPASASTIAGLRRLVASGAVRRSETVIALITGIGLKDPVMAKSIAAKNSVARSMISRFEGASVPRRMGESKSAILSILSHGADYAYNIRKRLAADFGRRMSLVSVYQHLNELDGLGLIAVERRERSPERRVRVYYALTDGGSEFLRGQGDGSQT
jgi:threonine synthase